MTKEYEQRARIFQQAMKSCHSNNPADCVEWLADRIIELEEANKTNEWHFVKDGDLPSTELGRADVTVAYINAYENPCKKDCCFDGTNFIYWDARKPVGWKKVDIFGKIYAWKYPEKLPELPKEIE